MGTVKPEEEIKQDLNDSGYVQDGGRPFMIHENIEGPDGYELFDYLEPDVLEDNFGDEDQRVAVEEQPQFPVDIPVEEPTNSHENDIELASMGDGSAPAAMGNDPAPAAIGERPGPAAADDSYRGLAGILDLSDDVLLYLLSFCTPMDLKALGQQL
ncbi:unnamed protein product [Chrysodeixis includens]|uniref:Uncharacterized protein n=1 Tax=Chrysodeixis includens TaxID=689277 RepID=A0A9N8L8B1_CHRIL|nr:unnamed protein product [Chrysodeixis includens]